MPKHRVLYGFFLNERGGIIDDLTITAWSRESATCFASMRPTPSRSGLDERAEPRRGGHRGQEPGNCADRPRRDPDAGGIMKAVLGLTLDTLEELHLHDPCHERLR